MKGHMDQELLLLNRYTGVLWSIASVRYIRLKFLQYKERMYVYYSDPASPLLGIRPKKTIENGCKYLATNVVSKN